MSKPIVGFDLDGVLYNWRNAVWDALVHDYKEKRTFFIFWTEEELASEGIGESHYNKMFWNNLVRREDLYSNVVPKAGVVDALKSLSVGYDIKYITHRKEWVKWVTESWLRRYDFPNVDELVFTDKEKHLAVRQHNCDYYVEDRALILNSELRNVCTLFGIRTITNDHLEGDPKITFIDEVPELLNYLGG